MNVNTYFDPVDLVALFTTPDGICRTMHMGVYQTVPDALEASGETAWTRADGSDRWRSDNGKFRVQPVST